MLINELWRCYTVMRVLLSCNSVCWIALLNAPNSLQRIIKLIEKEEIQIRHIFLNLPPIAHAPRGPVKTHHPSKMHQNQAVGGAVFHPLLRHFPSGPSV